MERVKAASGDTREKGGRCERERDHAESDEGWGAKG